MESRGAESVGRAERKIKGAKWAALGEPTDDEDDDEDHDWDDDHDEPKSRPERTTIVELII